MTFFYPGHFSGLGENLDQGEHQGDLKSWPEDNPSFAGTDLAPLISLNSFQTLLLLSPLPPPPHPRPFCSSWSKTLSLSWLEFLGFNEAISKVSACEPREGKGCGTEGKKLLPSNLKNFENLCNYIF